MQSWPRTFLDRGDDVELLEGEQEKGRREFVELACIALFLVKTPVSSILPMSTRMEPTPPKIASPARLSAFHAETKWDRRS